MPYAEGTLAKNELVPVCEAAVGWRQLSKAHTEGGRLHGRGGVERLVLRVQVDRSIREARTSGTPST